MIEREKINECRKNKKRVCFGKGIGEGGLFCVY